MKIFVTGGTGYIGRAVVSELVGAGHEVVGLTRREARRPLLEALGAEPLVGDLQDPEHYYGAAAASEAVVHIAADESSRRAAVDRTAVDTLLEAGLAGDTAVLVYTSGCFVLGDTGGGPAHEDASTAGAPDLVAWRPPHEDRVLDVGGGMATAVIRPGMVYGGTGGLFGDLFASASEGGAARFVGDGKNRWSPVHRGDVARLYRMLVERQGRGVFHCAEPAVPVADLAAAASRAAGAGGATQSVPVDEARTEMGPLADALTMDQIVGCRRAEAFGWAPTHAAFISSVDAVYREWGGPERPGG